MFNGIIRPLEERDIDSVEEIFDLYWSGEFRKHLSDRIRDLDTELKWLVAEENKEIVGVAASRKASELMRQYAHANNVIEFYISAARYKGQGIGTALRNARLADARNLGYAEAVLFSAETHQDSWLFHDQSDFKRVGPAIAPDGEKGVIWLMDLT